MKTCKDCKWYKSCMDICELSPQNCFVFEQRTNFDKVTISPEALAKFIYNAVDLVCSHEQCFIANNCHGKGCIECIADWLKKEAKETEK